jgi:shikimate dehydrogenase
VKHFTLFRYPSGFSASIQIHQAFAQQFALAIEYTQTVVTPGTLIDAIANFRKTGGVGANVTMPLKEEAFNVCTQRTDRATEAMSVNTLYWDPNNSLWGDNTDGSGFIRDVTVNHHLSFTDKRVCIIGAGGAAAGILGPLILEKPRSITLCNRSLPRAQLLGTRFSNATIIPQILDLQQLAMVAKRQPFDWIIKAAPISDIEPDIVKNALVYDLAYAQIGTTNFVNWCKKNGATIAIDGLGMLVEQAALSFSIWHDGKYPHTQSVIAQLRAMDSPTDITE